MTTDIHLTRGAYTEHAGIENTSKEQGGCLCANGKERGGGKTMDVTIVCYYQISRCWHNYAALVVGLMDGATYTLEVKPTKTTVMSSSGALKPGKVFTPKPAKAMDPKVAPRHGHCTDRLPQSKRVHLQDPIQTTFSIVTGTP
ncbi:uncharacterized protein LOC142775903 isoform X1 [Rhipicephalus microplus]|uniref:uncharacterized protein LOC142775903 isoform X1 n=1 Tax=Rhipicephalus microplus TaxID=6941 RepID=UPI003F6D058E